MVLPLLIAIGFISVINTFPAPARPAVTIIIGTFVFLVLVFASWASVKR